MKGHLQLTFALLFGAMSINAQSLVGTTVTNRNVILEAFSGVQCPNCVQAHQDINTLKNKYGSAKFFAVEYCPAVSSFTSPILVDLRRSYPDAFFDATYSSPSLPGDWMPSAMTNRLPIATNSNILKIGGMTTWEGLADNNIINKTSPINIGMKSNYNSSTKKITIDVEVYYTSTITVGNSLYVHLIEDSVLVDWQSGSGISGYPQNYVYNDLFREALTAQWGDPITGAKNSGYLFSKQFIFDVNDTISPINLSKTRAIAYVIEDASTEIYTGIAVDVMNGQGATSPPNTNPTAVNDFDIGVQNLEIFPNPIQDELNIEFETNVLETQLRLTDFLGRTIFSKQINGKGMHSLKINKSKLELSNGIYFVRISTASNKEVVRKVLVQ